MSNAYATAPAAALAPSTPYRKPLPRIDAWNRHFWDQTSEHVFAVQRDEEGNVWFPPSPVSPFTHTDRWNWCVLSGRGTVASWVVFHQGYFQGFAAELPYNVALIQLEEGPRIFTNLVDVDNAEIRIGMPVQVVFQDVNGALALPVFRPVEVQHECA